MTCIVLNPGESLTAVLGGAPTTTQPVCHVTWHEQLPGGDWTVPNPRKNQSIVVMTGATAVSLVATPVGGAQRVVDEVLVHNRDTVAAQVTLTKVSSGTSYNIGIASIPASGMLQSDEISGFVVRDLLAAPAGSGVAAGTGVTASEVSAGLLRKTTLTFVDVSVALTDEANTVAYGGIKCYDLPEGLIIVLGAVADINLTKSAAGVNADWDGDVGVGTVTASNNSTLTSTEQNIIPSTATPQAVAGVTTADGVSTGVAVLDGTTAAADVYVNLLVDDADQDVTSTPTNLILNGTLTLHWVNLGDK